MKFLYYPSLQEKDMKKNIFLVFYAVFSTSILILSACQTSSSSVFSAQCAAPCWRQIAPGQTKFHDAIDLIDKFQDLSPNDMAVWKPGQPDNIFSDILSFHLTNGEHFTIYAIDGIVALMENDNPTGITFEKCIKQFGEPEYATQFSVLGAGSPFFPSDAEHILFYTLSPKKGVVFGYDTQHSFDLKANTKISELSYFDVKLYDELYQNNFILGFDPFREIPQDKLHAWKGYGDIRSLYP
jgi:hypothetical protein